MLLAAENVTRGTSLGTRIERADSFWPRLRGLLGRDGLAAGSGLLLEPCGSIHTAFMAFPIDALFLDGAGNVLAGFSDLVPWRLGPVVRGARSVLELPAGTLHATGTVPGDRVRLLDRPTALG